MLQSYLLYINICNVNKFKALCWIFRGLDLSILIGFKISKFEINKNKNVKYCSWIVLKTLISLKKLIEYQKLY